MDVSWDLDRGEVVMTTGDAAATADDLDVRFDVDPGPGDPPRGVTFIGLPTDAPREDDVGADLSSDFEADDDAAIIGVKFPTDFDRGVAAVDFLADFGEGSPVGDARSSADSDRGVLAFLAEATCAGVAAAALGVLVAFFADF
jgi:hypothetical protein